MLTRLLATVTSIIAGALFATEYTRTLEYHLVKTIVTDSGGVGQLAIDGKRRRLYGAGNSVVDIDHNTVIAQLPGRLGHGYAVASDLNRVVTRRAAILDSRTLAVLDSGTDQSAATVVYDVVTRRAFVVGDTTIVLDVARKAVVARLWLGSRGFSATDDGRGHVYIGLASDTIVAVNSLTLQVDHRLAAGCGGPAALAIDGGGRRIFASCHNHQLVVLDIDTGIPVVAFPIASAAKQIAFDSISRLIFNPTSNGSMSVIREETPDRYERLPEVQTAENASAVATDPASGRVYLVRRHGLDAARVLVFAP